MEVGGAAVEVGGAAVEVGTPGLGGDGGFHSDRAGHDAEGDVVLRDELVGGA